MLIIRGEYVWTGEQLLTDAAVLCDGERIRDVGDWVELRSRYPHAAVYHRPGAIVLPGLINAHHHGNGVTSFQRGVRDDVLEPWLAALGEAPGADPYLDTLWAAIGLLQGGYTTVCLFQSTADPENAFEEAKARIRACRDAGLRVAFGLDLMQQNFYVYGPAPDGLPVPQGLTTDAYLSLFDALRSEFASEPQVALFAAPSGPQWVTDDAWEALGSWTLQNGIPLHTHCLESPYEAAYAERAYQGSVVSRLDRLGAIHRLTSLVHGVYLSKQELELMHKRGTTLITNPGSNLRLRCGVSPVLQAADSGVAIALGTDSCALGERDDAFAEMRLLLYLQRTPGLDTPALTWHGALHAALGGAAAVTPWGAELGTLRPGAWADLSLYDVDAVRGPWSHPDVGPVETLVQRAFAHHLVASVVGGRVVYDAERGPLRVDVEDVATRIAAHLNARTLRPGPNHAQAVREYFRGWPLPRPGGRSD